MVRISDIHTLNLDKNAPATQLYDSPNPNSTLFESKKGEVEQANVHYYASLIKIQRWALMHMQLWTVSPLWLHKKSVETMFV